MITFKAESNAFDRQERISWWSQEKVRNAKVMVIGAGAIGNEVLKNLALLGFGNIFVVDFDTISTSNLSRTVLFRRGDEGKKKAEVAAARTLEICLNEKANIDWFFGDVVWELGAGVYKEFDIVLACLDNVETRFSVNKQCWLVNTPWIDSGIYELNGHVSVFNPPDLPCYECHAPEDLLIARRKRYSCDVFKKAMHEEGRTPTVQVASAIIAAIQVQEAINIIHGNGNMKGRKIVYQGATNRCETYIMPEDENCTSYHPIYPKYELLNMTREVSLGDFLEEVSSRACSGAKSILDISSDWSFVTHIYCRSCKKRIEIYSPTFNVFDTQTTCFECNDNNDSNHDELEVDKELISEFSINTTENRILDMSLKEIGFPLMYIAPINNGYNSYSYFSVDGDKKKTIPNIYR